jgi:hypothetical protein
VLIVLRIDTILPYSNDSGETPKDLKRKEIFMIRKISTLTCLALLAACDGTQPLSLAYPETDGTTVNEGELPVPPGTEAPTVSGDISRYEDRNDKGGGLVTTVSYNATTDTFSVDNLGFDGPNVYRRGAAFATLNGYDVFDADDTVPDFLTGNPVFQLGPYRAIRGESTVLVNGEPRSAFSIVRTGGYVNFGFGGFTYVRRGGTTVPTNGQAVFTGNYAGMRVFDNLTGLEFTTGDARISVDFEDFNANDAVQGVISNRAAFTSNGASIGLDDDLIVDDSDRRLVLPDIIFVVREGGPSLNSAGEMQSDVQSTAIQNGILQPYETGTYNGILVGNTTTGSGGEIVGVIVVESDDSRFSTPNSSGPRVRAQETGGFILTR